MSKTILKFKRKLYHSIVFMIIKELRIYQPGSANVDYSTCTVPITFMNGATMHPVLLFVVRAKKLLGVCSRSLTNDKN